MELNCNLMHGNGVHGFHGDPGGGRLATQHVAQRGPTMIIRVRGVTERINEPPWARCLQGVDDARWVVVVVCCRRRPTGGSGLISGRALGTTVTLLRSNGDASMGLDDGAMR